MDGFVSWQDWRVLIYMLSNVTIMAVYTLAVISVARYGVFNSAWTKAAVTSFFAFCANDHGSMMFHALLDPVYRTLYATKVHEWGNVGVEAIATVIAAVGVYDLLNRNAPLEEQKVNPAFWGVLLCVWLGFIAAGFLNL